MIYQYFMHLNLFLLSLSEVSYFLFRIHPDSLWLPFSRRISDSKWTRIFLHPPCFLLDTRNIYPTTPFWIASSFPIRPSSLRILTFLPFRLLCIVFYNFHKMHLLLLVSYMTCTRILHGNTFLALHSLVWSF